MSRMISRRACGLAAGSAIALCALTAPAAEAANSGSLTYKCKFPLLGTQPVQLELSADIPDSGPVGVPSAPIAVTAKLTAGGDTAISLGLIEGTWTLGGVTDAQKPGKGTGVRARVVLPSGSGVDVRVPVDLDSYTTRIPPLDPLVLNGSGLTPPLTLDSTSQPKLVVTDFILNMYARYDDGTPVEGFLTPPTDIDRQPYADIDGDPDTFNVPCKLDPPDQKLELGADFEIPNQPPSKPGTPTFVGATPNSLTFDWGASTDDVAVAGYDVFKDGQKVATAPAGGGPVTIEGLTPNTQYTVRVEAFDAEGGRTASDEAILRTQAGEPGPAATRVNFRCKFPLIGTQPVELSITDAVPATWPAGEPTDPFSIAVRWGTGNTTGFSFNMVENLRKLEFVGDGAAPGKGTALGVVVRAPGGTTTNVRVPLNYPPYTVVPPVPNPIEFDGTGTLPSLEFQEAGQATFSASRFDLNMRMLDAAGAPIPGAVTVPTDVDRQPYADIDGDPATFNVPCKLDPATQNTEFAALEIEPPVVTPPVKYGYTLAGTTQIKTLTKGTLPIKGAIDAELTLATGAISADLTLADTSGRLVALGFLPVTAKIGFAPFGKTTGSLIDGVLKTNSKVRIKVKEIKLFGAIPLAGGNNCQTRSFSDINLQSTQAEFSPLVGGPIAGTYKISDLNGCGGLNGLVSPLTAGGGNTLNLNLTPKS